jgi:hypothetical protein
VGKKRLILLAVLGIAVVALVAWLSMPSPEPVYQGKPLSYWLAHPDGRSPVTYNEAYEAIRQIGTNAIPILLRRLQVPNPSLKDRVLALAQKQHFIKIPFAPAHLNFEAFTAFMVLGSGASNAVPGLIAIIQSDPDPYPQTAVPVILGQIGPAAEQAIPALLRDIAHTNECVRHNAVWALAHIHAQPKLVVPALIKCLNDPEADVRATASWALGEFGKDAQSAIPALFALQFKEAPSTRPYANYPTFKQYYCDPSSSWKLPRYLSKPDVALWTTQALGKIDPWPHSSSQSEIIENGFFLNKPPMNKAPQSGQVSPPW